MESEPTPPRRSVYIVGGVNLLPTVAALVLAADGQSTPAAGIGLCAAFGWLAMARSVRAGRL